jgi:signal transduction histidine kinase
VRLKPAEAGLRLEVEDTGIGIPKDDLPRIFEEFYRAAHAREHASDGTGFGLAIVKAVAEQHGGSVAVDSEVGRGTRFTVTVPLRGRS